MHVAGRLVFLQPRVKRSVLTELAFERRCPRLRKRNELRETEVAISGVSRAKCIFGEQLAAPISANTKFRVGYTYDNTHGPWVTPSSMAATKSSEHHLHIYKPHTGQGLRSDVKRQTKARKIQRTHGYILLGLGPTLVCTCIKGADFGLVVLSGSP